MPILIVCPGLSPLACATLKRPLACDGIFAHTCHRTNHGCALAGCEDRPVGRLLDDPWVAGTGTRATHAIAYIPHGPVVYVYQFNYLCGLQDNDM